ncbi:SAP domain-containing protein [Geobacter sp. SVR]|uniref:SAP domain-containing protein n=1 Tax=Geobacter sp. SVR TaxID=2495594 RepID=UPI00143EF551|nr:SAP domain-containing protein [Geobacter sp. SVR]BCS53369.1 hypothetical protein GSVR_16770 [Geobacter sp. SVR]GCF85505.1 SAP domain-containing protein [Geobacter sp. SVR]
MTFNQIRAIAAERGIRVAGMKKTEMVRAIQLQEGNQPCFDSGKAAECGQPGCLWVAACR